MMVLFTSVVRRAGGFFRASLKELCVVALIFAAHSRGRGGSSVAKNSHISADSRLRRK